MLNNGPYLFRIFVIQGRCKVVLAMYTRSTVQRIEGSFVYYFAMYMRNWVLNGYTGTGGIMFKHTSWIEMLAFFLNVDGTLGSVAY